MYEVRVSAAGVSGNLNQTLLVIRDMLEKRDVYAQIDAEQHGALALGASLSPPHLKNIGGSTSSGVVLHLTAKVTGESNSIKRGFAHLIAAGDTAAAFAVAAQSGISRATADPKKAGATISDTATMYTELPRDANGALTNFVPGVRKCFCGGEHLYRDYPQNDMWKQGKSGKWHSWIIPQSSWT